MARSWAVDVERHFLQFNTRRTNFVELPPFSTLNSKRNWPLAQQGKCSSRLASWRPITGFGTTSSGSFTLKMLRSCQHLRCRNHIHVQTKARHGDHTLTLKMWTDYIQKHFGIFVSALQYYSVASLYLGWPYILSGVNVPKMWTPAWFAAAKNSSLLRRIRSTFCAVKVWELSQRPWATILSALSTSWLQCFQEDWEASWLAFSAEVNSVCHVSTLLWLC